MVRLLNSDFIDDFFIVSKMNSEFKIMQDNNTILKIYLILTIKSFNINIISIIFKF